jgi:hypothetical protein
MKRSKIFLATTTALLAIVGVVAAKAHKFTFSTTAYYSGTGVNDHGCTLSRGLYYTKSTGTVEGYTQYTPNLQCNGLELKATRVLD